MLDGRPIRVLMIAPQFRPMIGGYERAAEGLSRALVRDGIHVTVVTERRDPAWPPLEVVDGFTIRRIWCSTRPHMHLPSASTSLVAFLLAHGREYDVWHAHQYGWVAALTSSLARTLDRPLVVKSTGTGTSGIARVCAASLMPAWTARQVRQVDACIATSSETAAEARAFGIDPARIAFIGNGIDIDALRPPSDATKVEARGRLGVRAERVAVYVGRLSSEKNPIGAVEAWEHAVRDAPHPEAWSLAIVGDGPMRAELEARVARSPARDTIILAGEVRDVSQWLAAADLFVLSSHGEGLSNALLEAMACGLAVATTRVSAVNALVDAPGAGISVDVGRMAELGAAIARLLSDGPLRDAAGRSGRQCIERDYSIKSVAARHASLYRRLIACRRSIGSGAATTQWSADGASESVP